MTHRISEWQLAWPVVAAGTLGIMLMTLHLAPLGVLMKPLSEGFGWSRAQISAGTMIITLFQCAFVPVIGRFLHRIALRSLALSFGLIYGAGLLMIASISQNIWSWYLAWAVLGLGIVGISPVIWTVAITRCFDRSRGLAFSVALSGTGITTLVLPLVSAWIYEQFGWRAIFLFLAALSFFVILPLLFFLMRRPEFGRGNSSEPAAPAATVINLQTVFMNRNAVIMLSAAILVGAAVGSVATHLLAMLRDAGLSSMKAASLFALAGPSLVAGRLAAGLLLDRFPTKIVALFLLLLPACTSFMLLDYSGSIMLGALICISFGLGYGAETDLFAYLCSRYFPAQHYALAYSLTFGLFSLSYGVVGVFAGVIFDELGEYRPLLLGLIASMIVAMLLLMALREREASSGHQSVLVPEPAI